MNIISFLDLVTVASVLYALGVLLLSPPAPGRLRGSLIFLSVVYLADAAPNFVEWLGFKDLVEPFELYTQILLPLAFFPFLAMAVNLEAKRRHAARSRVLSALHSITENLPSDRDSSKVWTETLERTIRVMGFDGGFVDFPGEGPTANLLVRWEGADEFVRQVDDLDAGKTVLGGILQARAPVIVERTTDSDDFFIQALRIGQATSVALFPVFSQDRVLGVMGVVSRSHHSFTREEVDLFTVLGRHLGELILNRILLSEAKEKNRDLEQALVSRSNFLQAVTDNLRDPMERLRNMVGVMGEKLIPKPNGECEDMLRKVGEDASQLEKLLRDVTELTRLEKEEGAPRFTPVDVRVEILKVAERHFPLAQKKGVALVTRIGESYAPVEADRDMLTSALHHLLSNALKYTPSGGSVTLAIEEDPERTRIRVADTGIGISEEDAAHIFEMFYRTGSARGRQKAGTGLGLPIVRMIARRHGGDVTFTSAVNKGTTFTLTLPRLQIK